MQESARVQANKWGSFAQISDIILPALGYMAAHGFRPRPAQRALLAHELEASTSLEADRAEASIWPVAFVSLSFDPNVPLSRTLNTLVCDPLVPFDASTVKMWIASARLHPKLVDKKGKVLGLLPH